MAHHTFARLRRTLAAGAAALMLPAIASAQAPTVSEWHHGSALTLFGGIASPNDDARGAAGGSVAWEFTPRFALDAMGVWFPAGNHDDVVFGSVGVRYAFAGSRPAVPYVTAGVGVYRLSFESGPPESFPGRMASMPDFYRRRMAMSPGGLMNTRQAFDDFAMRVGGGAEIFAGRHVSIRPELQLILVASDRHTKLVPLFGVHVAYHFESHPITPSRR